MFAMLCEMTSTLSCWACMPLAAIDSARIWDYSLAAEPLDRALTQFIRTRNYFDCGLIRTRNLDEPGEFDDRANVRAFERALQHHSAELARGLTLRVPKVVPDL